MIPAFEYLLELFERAKDEYKDELEHHYRANCQLAWQKLNDYYSLLDKSPAYLAAVILHPRYKWQYIESRWADKFSWIVEGKIAVKRLWEAEYR